ncbi:MAG: OsmC family protein [Acidobacteria bacterium]|nr:OsmC family protein [Acidobacteriota bacterium]
MLGTFGGALEARQVDASDGRLIAEVRGEVETEDGVLVIRRIHAAYTLQASEEVLETVQRVHDMHREHCPVYRSIHRAIAITTDFEIV